MRWILVFAAANAALLGLVLFMLWVTNGFGGLALSGHGIVALTMGVTLTAALAVALMALVFHSSRTEHDSGVHVAAAPDREHAARPRR